MRKYFVLLLMIFLYTKMASGEETNYPYKAVIKVPVADVYERPDVTTALHTQALFNEEIEVIIIPRAENIPLGSRDTFAMTARLFVNTRYLWGGCSWNGIDCSGLTYIAAKMNGIIIPRDSLPQSQLGINIDLRNAVAGDQLFFGPDARKARVTHTGIYLGNGNFIHSTIGGVDITNIYTSSYYRNRLMFAKRLPFR